MAMATDKVRDDLDVSCGTVWEMQGVLRVRCARAEGHVGWHEGTYSREQETWEMSVTVKWQTT